MKKKVLLVLSSSEASEEAVDFAVGRAKSDGAGLVALYLLETGAAGEVFDTFSDIGFIGEKPSTELSESIMKEYRQRGYEELGKVQIRAMEEGVDFEPLMEEGDFTSKVLKLIEATGAYLAVMVKSKKRRPLFKYFSRSLAEEVKERAHCEVVLFTES